MSSTSRAHTLRTDDKGRRGYHTRNVTVQTSAAEPPQDSSLSDSVPCTPAISEPAISQKQKRKQSNATSVKLKEFFTFRQSTLDELLRHDGPASFLGRTKCSTCGAADGVFKCRTCFDGGLLRCQSCFVDIHRAHPLHRVEYWNKSFFDKTTLQALGLRVQLGHGGEACPCPSRGPSGFCVVDISGAHPVSVDYCDCNFTPAYIQILRAGWFPATFTRPKTAFTFECLDTFHELTLQGKISLYDFHEVLMHKTDNLELSKSRNRYPELRRVSRLWRILLMLKRGARGQDPGGVDTTAQGELAVECPACPHPSRNLPENWQADQTPYLYTLFLAMDANFKLKLKDRGVKDLELAPGWSYFVREEEYQNFIGNSVDQPEISTCQSDHDAIARAAIRGAPGYSVNGTGLVLCPRHCLVRKNGVGDLQKGEKYCTMDYVMLSTLTGNTLPRIVITYDIGCQWSKNFRRRVEDFPRELQIMANTTIDVGIPSWHINGHGASCKANFSLGYMEGVGRTCGEEVETSWAQTNSLGASTREMGSGARHEALNDQWAGFNFRKIISFRVRFLKRLKTAYTMREKHQGMFAQFTSTFPVVATTKWEKMVVDWNQDRSKPNPYDEPAPSTTLQDVRLELIKEDISETNNQIGPPQKMTVTAFLMTGLELEEQQRRLSLEVAELKKLKTSKQKADLAEKRVSLLRRIRNWRQIQLHYMPHVASLLAPSIVADPDGSPPEQAEAVSLYLPSSLPPSLLQSPDLASISKKECRLRMAQAEDVLADIRRQRRIISGLWQFKRVNVDGTGNKPNTRMHALYARFNLRTIRCVSRYRSARSALMKLDPVGSWVGRFRELKDEDVRGPGKDDDMESNGRFEISWIWLVPRVSTAPDVPATEEVVNESMRAEWVKCRARKKRWEEEVLLIEEEMRRVVAYFEWKALWWKEQASRRVTGDSAVLLGIRAYGMKQACLNERMAERFARHWLPFFRQRGMSPEWGLRYPAALAQSHRAKDPEAAKSSPLHGLMQVLSDDERDEDDEAKDGEGEDGEDEDGEGEDDVRMDGDEEVLDSFDLDD